MRNSEPASVDPALLAQLKATASPVRLSVLADLKRPAEIYPPQVDGDFELDGVCADFIRARLGVSAATASRHLGLLADAGLLLRTRKRGWTFYRRNEPAIRQFTRRLRAEL